MKRWRRYAECIDAPADVFFPTDTRYAAVWTAARTYCAICEVKSECLAMACAVDETADRWGMFGGMTPAERRVYRYAERLKQERLTR